MSGIWRWIIAALLAPLVAIPAAAHPGWGIVEDSRGNLYYTDLEQVWKVAPDGTRSVAVPNVHTHELYLDASDNLYGEHLWYEGEATDRWGYRVWRRLHGGKIENVVPPTEGFRSSYSFIRDGAGNMYWQEDGRVHRASRSAGDELVSPTKFHDIRSMTVSLEGAVFLIDDGDLFRIRRGHAERLAANLGESSLAMPTVGRHHQVMGLWLDRTGDVYAAVFGGQKVKRVSQGGRVEVVARSTLPWSPSGGLVARDGSLWLLEYSLTNQARIRNASRPDTDRKKIGLMLISGMAIAAGGLAYFAGKRRRHAN